ncbi:thioredoxin domain-containing protein [Formosa sp. PL04]|uniref:thioredoxin domain-containing protein n=1 Tax=Formosa sp. PL04 TaxID=3081755 RepID=UPI00298268CB|nr:thioredoxin domain-containing protein [Formosa sp. PL04]MDW5287230.1 thioredoxin domain-containing protein [Formosa sp. PL04]
MKYIFSLFLLYFVLASCSQEKKQNTQTFKHTNDLINESSPYLLQHAHNPVDWKPWNEETLELAKKENKLIIVSIGYSACHWCHVMEHESFENDSVAAIMNENFINIKVDREERPDVDQVYMHAVQLLTGSGGWPLNCITLPDGRPVFGGTYFEKDQWMKVIQDISDLYKKSPEKVIGFAENLTEGIKSTELITVSKKPAEFKNEFINAAVNNWKTQFDTINGGQIGAPKFPMPINLNFLLQYAIQNNDKSIENHVIKTLTKMANGGIYDQVGGGFSRYATDETWHIPHFEKMLYDNAQLVSLYSNAYAITKNPLFKKIAEETLNFLERECLDNTGAFYSSIDADSKNADGELEEGAYYVWTQNELKALLGSDYDLFKSYYDVSISGLWENQKYVLTRTSKSIADISKENNIGETDLNEKTNNWNSILLEARNTRPHPRMDNKALTSWNALNINAYVDAYRIFQNPHYLEVAKKTAHFIMTKQYREDGGLNHVYINNKSSVDGYAEDYAATIDAFINLYQVTLDEYWLNTANTLMDYSITHFFDQNTGLFYFTSNNAPPLITRKIETTDDVIPSSNATLATSLFKLSLYYYDENYSKIAKNMMHAMQEHAVDTPSSYSKWLSLMMDYSNPFYEVVISGEKAPELLKEINAYYLPNIILAGATAESDLPLMENKYNPNQTYIYVCTNGTCKLPQTKVSEALKSIKKR